MSSWKRTRTIRTIGALGDPPELHATCDDPVFKLIADYCKRRELEPGQHSVYYNFGEPHAQSHFHDLAAFPDELDVDERPFLWDLRGSDT